MPIRALAHTQTKVTTTMTITRTIPLVPMASTVSAASGRPRRYDTVVAC